MSSLRSLWLILAAFCLLPSAFGSFISFSVTNYDGTACSNCVLIIRPVGNPAVDAYGNITAGIGLPTRITLDANGHATNRLQTQNYFVTNTLGGPNYLGQGYLFRAPEDTGPTVYPSASPGVLITGANYFVTQIISNGSLTLTYNMITNALGQGQLLSVTNLPDITNGFIRRADGTNISQFVANTTSNLLYSDYTTKIALKAAFADVTNIAQQISNTSSNLVYGNGVAQINSTSNILYLDLSATNVAIRSQINVSSNSVYTNAVVQINATSNSLQSQIGSAGISASTATNISQFIANTTSNLLYLDLSATNVAIRGQINTSSNLVYGNSATLINTVSNYSVAVSNYLQAIKIDKTNGFSTGQVANGLTLTNSVTSNTVAISVQTASGNLLFQRGTSSGADATIGSNSFSSGTITATTGFIGNGSGVSNAWSTNLTGTALIQVTNIAAGEAQKVTNGFIGKVDATNIVNALSASASLTQMTNVSTALIGVSNAVVNAVKMDKTNGYSTGQTATNLATEGNVSFGFSAFATNVLSGTNVLKFLNCGLSQITNGAFVWPSGFTSYTNRVTMAYITNNGSAWLLQTNGVTLYALSNSLPIGTWLAINGPATAPTSGFSFTLDHNGMDDTGWLSITNLNVLITQATNGLLGTITNIAAANGAISASNGFGTNTTLKNAVFIGSGGAGSGLLSSGTFNNAGGLSLQNFVGGGISNTIIAGSSGIASGQGNDIGLNFNTGYIGGGFFNVMSGGGGFQCVINGGGYNAITGGGLHNVTILGGLSNISTAAYTTIGGMNVTANQKDVFGWSDGRPLTFGTNNEAIFYATNGFGINTNYAGTNALRVGGNVDALGFTIQGVPISSTTTDPTASNFLANVKLNITNGTGTNLTVLGNFAMGSFTNFLQRTNVIGFRIAGASALTNGAYEWKNSLNYYTNTSTGHWITNNGSVNLEKDSTGTSLYSSTTLIGTWTDLGGGLPAPVSDLGTIDIANNKVIYGIVTSTNIDAKINLATNGYVGKTEVTNIANGQTAVLSNAFAPGVLTVTLSSNLVFARDSTEFVLNGCADTNANGVYVLSNAASIGLIYTNSANTAYYVVSNQFHSGPQRSWVLTNDSVGAIARSENVSTAPRQPSDGTQWTQILSTNAPTFWWHSTASYTNPVTTYFPFGYVLVDPAASTNGSKGPLNAFTNIDRAIAFAVTNDSAFGVTISNNFPLKIRLTAGLHPQGTFTLTPGMSLSGEGRGVSIINNGNVVFSGMSNYVADFKCNILQCSSTVSVSNSVIENMEIGTSLAIDNIYFPNANGYGVTVRNTHLITAWDATQGINVGTFINVGIDGYGGSQTTSSGLHGYNVTREDCNYTIIGGYVNLSGLNTNLNNPFNGSPPTNACIWITGTNATVNLYGPTLIHDTNNLAIYNFVGATNVNGWFHDINSSTGASTTVTVHGTNYFITGAITTTTPVAADFYGGLGSKSWLSNQTQFISSYNGSAISTAKVGP